MVHMTARMEGNVGVDLVSGDDNLSEKILMMMMIQVTRSRQLKNWTGRLNLPVFQKAFLKSSERAF